MEVILLVNGPNLNLLGQREPDIYGDTSLEDIEQMLSLAGEKQGFIIKPYQANCEGAIIDFLQEHSKSAVGLIINPGAFTHYSYAIRDCIAGIRLPAVEVHLSQIYQREQFRHKSVIVPVCIGQISGFAEFGYLLALQGVIDYLIKEG